MSSADTQPLPPADPLSLAPTAAESPGSLSPNASEPSELSQTIREASLASVMPGLQAAFTLLSGARGQTKEAGGRMLEKLSANITLLQDSFMEALYEKLESLGADISAKLTVRLDDAARLAVSGQHPDAAQINRLLDTDPELSAAFVEIATQSAALRDLRSLHALTRCEEAAQAYSALAVGPGECVYQLSLKGEMNHFYFTR